MDQPQVLPLSRMLTRLSDKLAQHPPSSEYEKRKFSANLDNARTTLLTLEKQASTMRIQSQRQQIQAELQLKRETIKSLSKQLEEIQILEPEDDDDEEEDEDARQASYAPAHTNTEDGLPTKSTSDEAQQAAQNISSTLRSRNTNTTTLSASDNRSAASTTARENLFSGRTKPDLSSTETLLSHNRHEQENLTSSLLTLASALKESSLQFSSSLDAEKDVLKRAEGALGSSATGMEAAERKMGMLRRMSEGQGWWGRIKLYAMIAGLWVGMILLVFVGPKIRL